MDVTRHKEAVLKVRLLPWIDENYTITISIEAKITQLEATQERIQGSSSTAAVTEQRVEEVRQVDAQCATKLAVIQSKLGGPRTKISAPTE